MNKDVIYVEPENDITDIITKIENSPEKIVVLVPPKKAGVFRSVVNIKLIARAANSAEKTVVLVTVDPSIVKLAAASRIPVTKDLKTPPVIPKLEEEDAASNETEIIEDVDEDEIEEPDGTKVTHRHEEKMLADKEEAEHKEAVEEEVPEEEPQEDGDKKKKAKKTKNAGGFKGWLLAHKKPVIACSIIVTVGVEIQTETKSFAENVKLTINSSEEDAKNGVFYIQEKKVEQAQDVTFEATGKKNMGDKAHGSAIVYAYLKDSNPKVQVRTGDTFSIQGLTFEVTQGATLSLDEAASCNNANSDPSSIAKGCEVQGTIQVEATQPGANFNINWDRTYVGLQGIDSCSGSTSGGTDKEVSIVEQIDVEKAKDQLKASNEDDLKQKLLSEVGDKMMPIESSFKIETGNAESTPGVGQEVGSGVTPTLKAVTTATIYAIDKAKLEEFITEKAEVPDDQKVYEIEDAFIENFAGTNGVFTGRLKGNYKVGPKVTDSEVAEKIKGKGLGDAQHDLKEINGVVNVTIDKSYPWVTSVPGDTNKITVYIDVKGSNNSGNSGGNGNNSGNDNNGGSNNGG